MYTLKSVNKSQIAYRPNDLPHIKVKRDVMVKSDHPFIVKVYFAFKTKKKEFEICLQILECRDKPCMHNQSLDLKSVLHDQISDH